MKKMFLLLSCAAAMTMASCSQEKTADTTTAADGTVTTTTTTTTTSSPAMYTEEAINSRADRIAADMAAKMKLDDATRTKVRTVYYNRSKRLGELQSQYTEDTTGMAAAMRGVYNDTDTELKTIFTDPAMYSTYESSRVDYYEDRYMDDASAMGTDESMSTTSEGTATDGTTNVTKMKAKDEAGNKIKVKSDGDVKTKDAAGNKSKVDADDGTIKDKPENGEKMKME